MPNEPDLPLVELSDKQRAQVDILALKLPPDAVRKRTRERFRDIKSWLTQRAPLPLSTELERVRETHKQILSHSKPIELPANVRQVLKRLLDTLPTGMRPDAGQFELFLLRRDDWLAASAGQNTLYLSSHAFERITAEPGGNDRLAFVLACEIASSCLGHCRSWYQSEWAATFVRTEKQEQEFARIESDDFTGTVLDRKPTAAETYAEDLFALHLCRQAGFRVNTMLDVLRQEVLTEAAELPEEPESLGGTRTPLSRHRRLLMELRGIVSNEECGLHQFVDEKWGPISDDGLTDTKRAIVLLHGLGSDVRAFDDMVMALRAALPDSIAILGLTYPDTDSLYRSSIFLIRELARTGAKPDDFDFICHSAGGLVFRHGAELHGIGFRTSTLIGTPSRGSDLASLRPLLEAQEFFGTLRGGLSSSVANAVEDESAQMVRDLEPRSLFLSELNKSSRSNIRSRYNIVRGQALTTRKSLLLALGVGTARAALRKLAESSFENERQESALGWISRLRIPEEVRSGDMAVTLVSATTADAAEVLTIPTAHTKLPEDPQVIDFVRRTIIGE